MTYTEPTNRIDLNNRIQHAIYRNRHELINCPTIDTVDKILAGILGEVLPLVDRAEHMAVGLVMVDLAQQASNRAAAVPTGYRPGDSIAVHHNDESYTVEVTERFIDGGEFWWRGRDYQGLMRVGTDDVIVSVTRKV